MAQQPVPLPGNDYTKVQEQFSDVIETHVNPWSAAILFGLRATKEGEDNVYYTRVRMPLQQAKALAVMLLRTLRRYEQETKTDIDLPKQVLQSLGIPPEDWQSFRGTK